MVESSSRTRRDLESSMMMGKKIRPELPGPTPFLVEEARRRSSCVKDVEVGLEDHKFVSPLRAIAFNFRFNQIFGVLPATLSEDFMVVQFNPLRLLITLGVKVFFISTIAFLISYWLADQGADFAIFLERIFETSSLTKTDKFAIVSHFSFLLLSALILFVYNLGLCKELTNLNNILKILTNSNHLDHPSARGMICYRVSTCLLCTVASLLYFLGIHNLTRNPEINGLDYLLIFLLVISFYIENQNHMFSELLFMRYSAVLLYQAKYLRWHFQEDHTPMLGSRACCHERSRILNQIFTAVNQAFGGDLLVTTLILVISVTFGIYLTLTFTVFIGEQGTGDAYFIAAYLLYSVIPAIRYGRIRSESLCYNMQIY